MKKNVNIFVVFVVIATFLLCVSAHAHEFIIKPVQLNAAVGHKLPFSVVSAHVFMISEEVEPIEQVTVTLIEGTEKNELKLMQNDMLLTLDGVAELKKEGTAIFAGHRKGVIWTKTTKGWKQASKQKCEGVISSGKYEKFCKTFVNVGKADSGYKKVIGHKLEIVPVSNPAEALVGKYLNFRILLDGKPLSTEVWATFDGFTDTPNTYAYYTKTNVDGIAKIKITHPGTWMVRVEKKVEKATEDYDKHVMRAICVFGIN
jgi:uncharacterized GH25 family protein